MSDKPTPAVPGAMAMTEEREIACEVCNGDGEFEVVVGRGGWTGPVTEYRKCTGCNGTGRVVVKFEPITMEDFSPLPEDLSEEDQAMIDAAWERHKKASPNPAPAGSETT